MTRAVDVVGEPPPPPEKTLVKSEAAGIAGFTSFDTCPVALGLAARGEAGVLIII